MCSLRVCGPLLPQEYCKSEVPRENVARKTSGLVGDEPSCFVYVVVKYSLDSRRLRWTGYLVRPAHTANVGSGHAPQMVVTDLRDVTTGKRTRLFVMKVPRCLVILLNNHFRTHIKLMQRHTAVIKVFELQICASV